jgi:GTP-binding protein HflX
VLDEIGAGAVPQIWVCNKCDLLEESRRPRQAADWVKCTRACAAPACSSVRHGEGLDALRRVIAAARQAA